MHLFSYFLCLIASALVILAAEEKVFYPLLKVEEDVLVKEIQILVNDQTYNMDKDETFPIFERYDNVVLINEYPMFYSEKRIYPGKYFHYSIIF